MILVLDTGALWHAPLLEALGRAHGMGFVPSSIRAILPAVAYAERRRQLLRDGLSTAAWKAILGTAGIEVAPFGEWHGDHLADESASDAVWGRHARDFLIAAHAGEGRWVVTEEDGPAWSRLDVLRPEQAVALLQRLAG